MKNGKFDVGFDIDWQKQHFKERIPQPDPGEHFKDMYPDKLDPRGDPYVVELRWNRHIKELKDCDTVHLICLLKIACELHRKWVIGRNKYFSSIRRCDRFISHIDAPQTITNILNCHIKDTKKYVFDGAVLESKDEWYGIELLSGLGM